MYQLQPPFSRTNNSCITVVISLAEQRNFERVPAVSRHSLLKVYLFLRTIRNNFWRSKCLRLVDAKRIQLGVQLGCIYHHKNRCLYLLTLYSFALFPCLPRSRRNKFCDTSLLKLCLLESDNGQRASPYHPSPLPEQQSVAVYMQQAQARGLQGLLRL